MSDITALQQHDKVTRKNKLPRPPIVGSELHSRQRHQFCWCLFPRGIYSLRRGAALIARQLTRE